MSMKSHARDTLLEAADNLIHALQTRPLFTDYVSSYVNEMSKKINEMNNVLNGKEIARVNMRLSNFDVKNSNIVAELYKRFGSDIRHKELLAVADVVSQKAEIKIDRDAKRRKKVLFKWFEENWELIHPLLDFVVLEEPNKVSEPETISDPFSDLINVPMKKEDRIFPSLLLNPITI